MTDVKKETHSPTAKTAPPPPAPPKQYMVVEEFVSTGGARYLAGSGPLSLPEEEAAIALKDGAIEEYVPPPVAPGVAPKVPPMTTHGKER